jgi:hypothetical protein
MDNPVRFEVFTAVTMKNAVFWDVVPCRSCVNRRFGGRYCLHFQGRKIRSHWDREFESNSRHGCQSALILFLLSCVEAALKWADPPSKEPYHLSIWFIISVLILIWNRPRSLIRQGIIRRRKLNESLTVLKLNINKYFFVTLIVIKITKLSSGMFCCEVCWIVIDVSEEGTASIFRTEEWNSIIKMEEVTPFIPVDR